MRGGVMVGECHVQVDDPRRKAQRRDAKEAADYSAM
jgi:hypothetical protein